jgi:lactoylglutathione lyase
MSDGLVGVDIFESLGQLPYFNPEIDVEPAPEAVAELRAAIQAADGLLIATPEYAHEMPGVLKNALDWLVGSGELYAKPVAILSAAPSAGRGEYARRAVEQTLAAQGSRVVLSATVAVTPAARRSGETAPETVAAVAAALDALANDRAVSSSATPTVLELRLVVTATEYDEALRFYRDSLGLTERAAFSSPGGRVTILDAGRATLELTDLPHAELIDQVEVGRRVAGHIRVALQVDDSPGMTARLIQAGAVLIAEPTRTPWNSLNARLEAPAGLQLTLFSELEARAEPVR